MKHNDSIVITYDEKKGVIVKMEGEFGYQDGIALSNALTMHVIRNFVTMLEQQGLDEEELEAYKAFTYDDLNQRFSNLLEPVTPKVINESFDEMVTRELHDQDRYIELAFKESQYDKIIAASKEHNKGYTKVTVQENGEFDI